MFFLPVSAVPVVARMRLQWFLLVFAVGWGAPLAHADEPVATNLWTLPIGSFSDTCAALSSSGTLYFGTFDGKLWAVKSDGSPEWTFSTGHEIKSSPAIGQDSTLYFGCRDRHLYAVSADGLKQWTFKTGAWVDASPALTTNGDILVGSWDGNFYAVDAKGNERWRFKTGGPVVSSAAISREGIIYFGSNDGMLYALAPDGRKSWSFATGGPIIASPALGLNGEVCCPSLDGFLYCLNADGSLRWKLHTGGVTESSPVIGPDNSVYVGVNLHMWGITPDGKKKWERGTDRVDVTAALTEDGGVLFIHQGGALVSYDRDRGHRWYHYLLPHDKGSPTVSPSGIIFVSGMGLSFVAVRPETPSPLANTPWPKFRGNLRNTGNLAD